MKRNCRIILIVASTLLSGQVAYASSQPTTFLGPVGRASVTGLLTDTSDYSFAGEGGPRIARLSGTVGFNMWNHHYLKLSAEYLWQNINYGFFDSHQYRGNMQGALGLDYRFLLYPLSCFDPEFHLNMYYSMVGAATLGVKQGVVVNNGVAVPFVDARRLADSHSTGVSPGVAVQFWRGSKVGVDLNYDNVEYDFKYVNNLTVKGVGATAYFSQRLAPLMTVDVSAGIRKPYNNYQADLAWEHVPYFGPWTFKIIGDYTVGKLGLPNTYDIGLSADYFLDTDCEVNDAQRIKNEFMAWSAQPAVYMPEILTIPEDQVTFT